MDLINDQIRLAARPQGLPKPTDWKRTTEPVPDPQEGQLVVENRYLSLDPAMRGWMNEGRSYVPPVGLGEVMRAGAAGEVIASRHPKFAKGDHVVGLFGVQSYAVSDGKGVTRADAARLPTYLGALGMPGYTAYFGLLDVGKLAGGETVVVSGAAGAVGTIAAQIAKLKGCRTIGIAGGPEKCRYLTEELGLDAAIDYKAGELKKQLKEAAPNGIDIYFDNVGGEILDAALARLALHARVVLCGAISQYNADSGMKGPSNYMSLLVNRARMEGFVVFDYAPRYKEAATALATWIDEGKIKTKEQIVAGGLDAFHDALLTLFRGGNTGKLVLAL